MGLMELAVLVLLVLNVGGLILLFKIFGVVNALADTCPSKSDLVQIHRAIDRVNDTIHEELLGQKEDLGLISQDG